MGRRNSKRRILIEGKEGWAHVEGVREEVTNRMCCRACGASVSKLRFYDTDMRTEACAKPPPDTAAPAVAAGGDGASATSRYTYHRPTAAM
eukprot:jgi/Tetstr1/453203/TSEL_040220.t1